MQSSFFTLILLPLALAIVMLGMGLSLVPEDFKRIRRYPRAVAVGTVCQILLLPLMIPGPHQHGPDPPIA